LKAADAKAVELAKNKSAALRRQSMVHRGIVAKAEKEALKNISIEQQKHELSVFDTRRKGWLAEQNMKKEEKQRQRESIAGMSCTVV